MTALTSSGLLAGIESRNRIDAQDVQLMRREAYGDGTISRAEADALLQLNAACPDQCPEWHAFFVEALTDYIVHQEKPAGYISVQNAEWLIEGISRDGLVRSLNEFELLVRVLEVAKFSPERLVRFALEQVKQAVVEAKGPLMIGGELVPGLVGATEVELLRRILYAFGGDGNIAITRSEAEVLFEINDATADSRNDPAWNDLFVKAIANFVMCTSGYEAPTREVALRQENFFDRADADISGFFARMASGGARGMLAAYRLPTDIDSDWEARNQCNDANKRRAERIDNTEAKWLAERIGRNGRLHDNERALVKFIEQSSPSIHPDLRTLLEKVA
jgi:hypothetical protein